MTLAVDHPCREPARYDVHRIRLGRVLPMRGRVLPDGSAKPSGRRVLSGRASRGHIFAIRKV